MYRTFCTFVILMASVLAGCTSSGRIAAGWGREIEDDANAGPASTADTAWSARPESEVDRTPSGVENNSGYGTADAASPTTTSSSVRNLLQSELDSWMGVPYVLGGTSHRGVDCSGLVQQVYSDVFNIRTPRTTSGLRRMGSAVSGRSLRTGDLVFFEPAGNSHVGIYLGNDEFAHASSSSGVMVSSLTEPYWRRAYTMSRRILGSGNLVVGGMISGTGTASDLQGPHW